MTKTELEELEQKYLPRQDTPTAQQILRLINDYRQLERQLTVKNNLGAPQAYQVCLEVNNWEEQMGASCQNYPPAISEEQLARMQGFARQQHLLDIQERETRRQERATRQAERQKGKTHQNLELFEDEH